MANTLVQTSANQFIRVPGSPTRSCPKIMESTDEILASSSHRRNCRRRHCHCRSVLRLLGHDGSDRVDRDKLYALLVGSRWDPRNGSRPDRNGGAASLDGFGIAAGCFWRNCGRLAKLQQDAHLESLLAVKSDQQDKRREAQSSLHL